MNYTPILRGTGLCFLVLSLSAAAFADTIRLKDGGIIKGKVVGFNGGSFVVSIGEGSRRREMRFLASEVESVQFDTTEEPSRTSAVMEPRATYKEVSSKPASKPEVVTPVTKQPESRQASTGSPKAVEFRTRVLGDNTSNGWTNSGWVVKKGQRIRIIAESGTISLGNGKVASASGLGDIEDDQKLLRNVPTGALIAVIGDDNNDFIYIGSEREFTATREGALFLGINEGNLSDNSGHFNVRIEILPEAR